MTFSFSKHSSVIYACLRHKVILILPVLFRIQDSQREKMKNPAALVFALATLCVMECYVSGIKIYHQRQVIFKFMLLKEKRCYLAVTQEYFTCNKNNYDESKSNLSLACEQSLLFGRAKQASRERASEGTRKGELATISHKFSFPPRKPRDSANVPPIRKVTTACRVLDSRGGVELFI